MQVKIIFILLNIFSIQISCGAGFLGSADVKKMSSDVVGLTFLNNVEARKKLVSDLEIYIEDVKKRGGVFEKQCADIIVQIHLDAAKIQNQGKGSSEKQIEYLNRKLSILITRKQNLINSMDMGKEAVEIIEKRIALQNEIIGYLQSPKIQYKPLYSWKEFQDAQIKISEQIAQVELGKNKIDMVKKQLTAAKETLLSLQKQLDSKEKERDKIIGQANQNRGASNLKNKFSGLSESEVIRFESEIIDQEVNLLKERIINSNQKIEKLTEEDKLKESELELLQLKVKDEKESLTEIERRLILDFKDIEIAKTELNKEVIRVAQIKNEISKFASIKKQEKEKMLMEQSSLQEQIKQLESKSKPEISKNHLEKSKLQKIVAMISIIDRELLLLDAKKDIADIKSKMKELQYRMIEIHYRLNNEKPNIRELLVNYKSQRDIEAGALKGFNDKGTEAVNSLVETQRLIGGINSKLDKIRKRKFAATKSGSEYIEDIFANYETTKNILTNELYLTQDFLAMSSDLINQQTSILNYYDLIITDLEIYKTTQSIWKRDLGAISLEALELSAFEAEDFLKKFFWDTPNYISPKVLIIYFKTLGWPDLLLLILLVSLFLFGLCLTKKLWSIFVNKFKSHTERIAIQSPRMYLIICKFLIDFILDHFELLYSWLFIFILMRIDFGGWAKGLSFLFSRYYQAMFYLATIGIFVFISSRLLILLKNLNKKLSYMFFAETIQGRLFVLLAVFAYSTSILLPLRLAYLSYVESPAYLGEVLMAFYSLILLIVLMLFFTKDEILQLIPSSPQPIFLWFRRKAEKYYYPVFFFIMSLLILSNANVGYKNMAWYLAFAIPSSFLLLYVFFMIHNYIRKYSLVMFMEEDEDQIKDRFEYAKTYYGIFIIGTFLFLLFIAFTFIARIWGYDYTLTEVWRLLSETWVIQFDIGHKLGVVQFLTLGVFILSGFLFSSLLDKFVLTKLFEILRSEPGTQNTISKITHYLIVGVAILLGFMSIHLGQFVWFMGGLLCIGLSFALKDVAADFVAGFFVLIERPIEIGNYIQVDSVEGTVHKISPRTTTVITSRNFAVFIPNKDLLAKNIINWSNRRFAMGFEIYIRVTHESDPDLVRKLIMETLQSHPVVLKLPAVVVRLEEFEENALYFMSRAFISTQRLKDSWIIASDLRIKLIRIFRENGIKLARPQRVVYVNEETNESRIEEKKPLSIKFDKE